MFSTKYYTNIHQQERSQLLCLFVLFFQQFYLKKSISDFMKLNLIINLKLNHVINSSKNLKQ